MVWNIRTDVAYGTVSIVCDRVQNTLSTVKVYQEAIDASISIWIVVKSNATCAIRILRIRAKRSFYASSSRV